MGGWKSYRGIIIIWGLGGTQTELGCPSEERVDGGPSKMYAGKKDTGWQAAAGASKIKD